MTGRSNNDLGNDQQQHNGAVQEPFYRRERNRTDDFTTNYEASRR